MTTRPMLFVDTETTRLRRPYLPGGRRIWEIGGVRVDPDGTEHPLHLFIRIADLGLTELADASAAPTGYATTTGEHPIPRADWYELLPQDVQTSLEIGGFHRRHPERIPIRSNTGTPVCSESDAALTLLDGPWLRGRPVIIGAVPNFDDLGLHDLLWRAGYLDPDHDLWDYHLVCAETLAAGALGWPPPWSTDELSLAVGVDPDEFARHTAVDDARWARALYEAALRHGARPRRSVWRAVSGWAAGLRHTPRHGRAAA